MKSGTKWFSQKCENYPTLVVSATLSLRRTINEHEANCKLIIWIENMYIWLYLYFLIKSFRMNIEIQGHMNTPKWVFNIFYWSIWKISPKKSFPILWMFWTWTNNCKGEKPNKDKFVPRNNYKTMIYIVVTKISSQFSWITIWQ